ncbi:50S ribosomal protein L37ae [Candidatus Woesearchaeota archaeon]|nr:MAG: 50S ribosomal protein L37ae [Candidatus Woesearchaeota archaeon]
MKTKKVGSTGRFGPRYGRKVKAKILAVEKVQKQNHKCPYCHRLSVKRVSAGIWHCKKCDAKFTGKAYRLGE